MIKVESTQFASRLLRRLLQNASSVRSGNTDLDRFGYPQASSLPARFRDLLVESLLILCQKPHLAAIEGGQWQQINDRMFAVSEVLDGLEDLYERLSDKQSRDLLIELIIYKILGSERVSLPLDCDEYWKRRERLRSLFDFADPIPVGFNDWKLAPINLLPLGYPITIYSVPIVIHTIFDSKQYEYRRSNDVIKAGKGEVVIDAGGCWGDSALYFANEVGSGGRVYTFEFIPTALDVMRRNLALNPGVNARIEVVERPVWARSNEILYFSDSGPGSRVSSEKFAGATPVLAISLDDFVRDNHIERIDFIKMDVEGAELNALKGATAVLKTFRPRLAISIYHKLSDFAHIPEFISNLELSYELYLGHYTVHSEETILFALPRD